MCRPDPLRTFLDCFQGDNYGISGRQPRGHRAFKENQLILPRGWWSAGCEVRAVLPEKLRPVNPIYAMREDWEHN